MDSLIFLMLLAGGYVFFSIFWFAFKVDGIKKMLLSQKPNASTAPAFLKPLKDPSFDESDIRDYVAAKHWLDQSLAAGKIQFNDMAVASSFNCSITLYSWKRAFNENKLLSLGGVISMLFFPIGWLGPIFITALYLFTAYQASQFLPTYGGLRAAKSPLSMAPPPPPSNLSEELAKLNRLHKDGAITDEEFKAAKENVLKRSA